MQHKQTGANVKEVGFRQIAVIRPTSSGCRWENRLASATEGSGVWAGLGWEFLTLVPTATQSCDHCHASYHSNHDV